MVEHVAAVAHCRMMLNYSRVVVVPWLKYLSFVSGSREYLIKACHCFAIQTGNASNYCRLHATTWHDWLEDILSHQSMQSLIIIKKACQGDQHQSMFCSPSTTTPLPLFKGITCVHLTNVAIYRILPMLAHIKVTHSYSAN